MFIRKIFILLLFCVAFENTIGQSDSVLIKKLLTDIAFEQVRGNDPDFFQGTFPSYRECGGIPHNYQPDYNIFYTAVIAFTLPNLLPELSGENKLIAKEIIARATASYDHYKNKNYPFYNFWPAGKEVLPHSFWWHKLSNAFNRGDDADDTALMLMSMNADDSTSKIVKQRMIETSNLYNPDRKINTTYKMYRNFPAYSTYLGLKSPPDFDFGVQCNLLYFMYDRKLPLTKQDTATIHLLQQMIAKRKYMKAPVYISPYYVTRPILLYHLARLMGKFIIPELEKYKQQIIDDIKKELSSTESLMEQIILNTSLLRLGERSSLKITEEDLDAVDKIKFPFCQARAAYNFPSPFKQVFLHWNYMIYYFYCPAYNKTLLLEYLTERSK